MQWLHQDLNLYVYELTELKTLWERSQLFLKAQICQLLLPISPVVDTRGHYKISRIKGDLGCC